MQYHNDTLNIANIFYKNNVFKKIFSKSNNVYFLTSAEDTLQEILQQSKPKRRARSVMKLSYSIHIYLYRFFKLLNYVNEQNLSDTRAFKINLTTVIPGVSKVKEKNN